MPKKLLMCIVAFTLAGCGATPEPAAPPAETTRIEPVAEPVVIPPTPEEWLQAARESTSLHSVQVNLLRAAKGYLDEDKPHHAGAILVEIKPSYLRQSDFAQFELQKGRFFAALSDWNAAMEITQGLDTRLADADDRQQLLWLYYAVAEAKQDHFAAGLNLIRLEPKWDGEPLTERIWNHLRKAPADVWRSPPRENLPSAQGWFSLLQRLTMVLDGQMNIQSALENWQRNYPEHPAQAIVQRLQEDPQIRQAPERVAVLLPLSGQFANEGEAVRVGILAALAQQGREHVMFVDTAQFNATEIKAKLEDFGTDLVVGPLDRDALERLHQLDEWHWLQLSLNHPSSTGGFERSSYFALDLATETQAAASALNAQGYKGVLLLGPNTNRARQLADLFTGYWREQNPQGHIRAGHYSASTEMRELVREMLKVNESEQRKAQIERLLDGTSVEMEFRSRQDIDAIYLLGDAPQARLLKPFIEVSLSAFGRRIPVYANSTVNEEAQTQGEADLVGVRFADAPWLLPEHEHEALHRQLGELISGWNRSQQRLTAMGYDSIRLAPRLALMRQLDGYTYTGLSGQLRIVDNILVRELSWAMFEDDSIRLAPIEHVNTSNRNPL